MSERLFDLGEGALCPGCSFERFCGGTLTEHACAPRWGDPQYGGLHVVHPHHPERDQYMLSVRGADYMNVKAQRVSVPLLPRYLPQLRLRRGLRGSLHERIYGIRGWEIIGRRDRLLTAAQVREELGLKPEQKLVLILFDNDQLLERLWYEADVLLPDLAEAAFDLVVSPSYSIYHPRPRLEHLYNFKRALEIFASFQQLLIPAIPRGAWFIEFDVRRLADWLNANRLVKWLAVDLQTVRQPEEWLNVLHGFSLLDQLTNERVRFLVNGPTTVDRIRDVYAAANISRVSITSSTLAAPLQPSLDQLSLPVRGYGRARYEFERRCLLRRQVLRTAAELVGQDVPAADEHHQAA